MNNSLKYLIFIAFALIAAISCTSRDRDNPLDPGFDDDFEDRFELKLDSHPGRTIVLWKRLSDESTEAYNVYRALDDTNFVRIAVVDADSSSYVDTNVFDEITYFYKINATFDDNLESPFSSTLKITTGSTNTWILDFSGDFVVRLTHDLRHKTGQLRTRDCVVECTLCQLPIWGGNKK